MRNVLRQLRRIQRLAAELKAAAFGIEERRLAWQAYCTKGRLPDEPVLREQCELLIKAEAELEELHTEAKE